MAALVLQTRQQPEEGSTTQADPHAVGAPHTAQQLATAAWSWCCSQRQSPASVPSPLFAASRALSRRSASGSVASAREGEKPWQGTGMQHERTYQRCARLFCNPDATMYWHSPPPEREYRRQQHVSTAGACAQCDPLLFPPSSCCCCCTQRAGQSLSCCALLQTSPVAQPRPGRSWRAAPAGWPCRCPRRAQPPRTACTPCHRLP